VAVPVLLATPRADKTASITVAITSPNPRRDVVHSALSFAELESVIVAFEGVVMRIILIAAVFAASCALGGCFFHFHTSQVYTAPQALPPLK